MKYTAHDLEVTGSNPVRLNLGYVVLLSKSYLNQKFCKSMLGFQWLDKRPSLLGIKQLHTVFWVMSQWWLNQMSRNFEMQWYTCSEIQGTKICASSASESRYLFCLCCPMHKHQLHLPVTLVLLPLDLPETIYSSMNNEHEILCNETFNS